MSAQIRFPAFFIRQFNRTILLCSKDAVPCITQTWTDIGILIQAAVQMAHIDLDIRMGCTETLQAFRRSNDGHKLDLFPAVLLDEINLRGGFKKTIMDYIAGKYPDLVPLYDEIYNKHNRSYFEALEVKAEKMAKKYDCAFVDNEMPYGRVPQGHPVIVDYFYHEEIRGTENTGKRNR